MAFPYKDDTSTGGACLCEDCAFCDNHILKGYYKVHLIHCRLSNSYYHDVGICKDFMRGDNNG